MLAKHLSVEFYKENKDAGIELLKSLREDLNAKRMKLKKGAEEILKQVKATLGSDFEPLLNDTFGEEGKADIAFIKKLFEKKAVKTNQSNDFRSFLKSQKNNAVKPGSEED